MTKRVKRSAASAAAAVTGQVTAASNPALAAWPFPKSRLAGEAAEEPAHESHIITTAGSDGDRIRVDQVRLFTDATSNVVERLTLDQLRESPFNPRTRYDAKALQDLAETIRGVGVASPLLVRRLSLDGLFAFNKERPGHEGEPPPYEIVFGHRRFRAAKLAGEMTVPAIVRELTDAQSAQLQAIENVQRQNPDPIDEGRGYQHYIQVHGVSADQLADEIGMSRTHVYNRIKLLNAVEPVQASLRAGDIDAEVALLIARLHSPAIQAKALASLKSNHHRLEEGGEDSYRSIKRFLKEKFTLKLKEALFPTTDATLLEGADACTTCPKRTGNAPEYSDIAEEKVEHWVKGGPDLCTDPECWEAKTKQHLANEAAKLEAQGKTVVTGAKARQAVGADGKVKGAYVALADVKGELAKAKKAGKGGEVQTIVIQDPRTGKNIQAVKRDEVKTAGVKVKDAPKPAGRYDYEADRKKREAEERRNRAKAAEQTRINSAVLGAVRQAAAGAPLPAFAVHMVVQAALAGVAHGDRPLLALLHGFKNFEQLRKGAGQMPVDKLTTLLLDCALVENVTANPWHLTVKPDTLLQAAKHWEVDVEEIRADLAAKAPDTATQDLLQQAETEEEQNEEGAEA
jgi:ParB/RepB/Spo0J family partition protein